MIKSNHLSLNTPLLLFLVGASILSFSIYVEATNKINEFHRAAIMGDLEKVQFYLQDGVWVDAPNIQNKTALFFAAEHGHLNIVETLIKNGANANAYDNHEKTPLMYANENGHKEIANLLMKNNAHMKPKVTDQNVGSDSTIYKMQTRLKKLGYRPGPIDGVWGEKTKKAMQLYQKQNGLPITEHPTGDLIEELGITTETSETEITYKGCVSRFADTIAKKYRLKAEWIEGTDKMHLSWLLQKSFYVETKGTPDEIFKFIDNQTLEDNNYLQKSKEECDKYAR